MPLMFNKVKYVFMFLFAVLLMAPAALTAREEHIASFLFNMAADIPMQGVVVPTWRANPVQAVYLVTPSEHTFLIPRVSNLYLKPVTIDLFQPDVSRLIRQTVTCDPRWMSLGSLDVSAYRILPYTLYSLIYKDTYPSMAEGIKYQALVYQMLDESITNIISRTLIAKQDGYDKAVHLSGLKKPTEDDWKELRMKTIFLFLADQRLKNIHKPFESERK